MNFEYLKLAEKALLKFLPTMEPPGLFPKARRVGGNWYIEFWSFTKMETYGPRISKIRRTSAKGPGISVTRLSSQDRAFLSAAEDFLIWTMEIHNYGSHAGNEVLLAEAKEDLKKLWKEKHAH